MNKCLVFVEGFKHDTSQKKIDLKSPQFWVKILLAESDTQTLNIKVKEFSFNL
jgi:hypothetical protein